MNEYYSLKLTVLKAEQSSCYRKGCRHPLGTSPVFSENHQFLYIEKILGEKDKYIQK